MAINMDGTTYDSVDEFFEVMDGMYERGMMKIDDMPDPDKFREYLAEKNAEEVSEEDEDSGAGFTVKIAPEGSEKAIEDVVKLFAKKSEEEATAIKEGDKVRIIGNRELLLAGDSVLHHFEIGDVGEVMSIDSEGDLNVKVSGSKCCTQFVSPEHVEIVEPIAQDANGEDLYEGDLVTGVNDVDYFFTDSKALMEVTEDGNPRRDGEIKVSVVKHVNEKFDGLTERVKPEYFVKTTEEEYYKTHNPKIEVGSKVIALKSLTDFTEGDVYEVIDIDGDNDYGIIDDEGERSLLNHMHIGEAYRLATDEEVADAVREESGLKFKVGDKVRVVGESKRHYHRIGDVGEVVNTDESILGKFDDPQPYEVVVRGRAQHHVEKDLELVADSEDFQAGDIVMVNETFMDITRDVAEEGLAEVFVGASGNMYVKQPHSSGIGVKVSSSIEGKLTLVCRAEDRLDTENF